MIRRRLVIAGRVQGVFYRAWFAEQAKALELDGWVRHRADGTVEALVQGPSAAVELIAERARMGPLAARVTDVIAHDDVPDQILIGFQKQPTA